MNAGISVIPANLDARNRRAPKFSTQRPACCTFGRTEIGCRTPRSRIVAARSASASASNSRRGCSGSSSMSSTGSLNGRPVVACIGASSDVEGAFFENEQKALEFGERRARDVMEKLRATAHEAARAQAARAQESERVEAERVRLARWYSRGKWIGRLFDPSI